MNWKNVGDSKWIHDKGIKNMIINAKIGKNFGKDWRIFIPLDQGLMIVIMFVR